MKLVCISDTHLMHMRGQAVPIPLGDVLIHAGDATFCGNRAEIAAFAEWCGAMPHRHKLFVAGNHDWGFQRHRALAEPLLGPRGIVYLQDSGVEIDGVKFWGSPWQPAFNNWAFNLPRGKALREHWDMIPSDTDVLITHGPPHGIGDWSAYSKEHVGCEELRKAVERINPKVHVFGHIHNGHGRYGRRPMYINASICNESYVAINRPMVAYV